MTYLDTHAVMALHKSERKALRQEALDAIEAEDDLRISPMVLLELQYLHEIGRITAPATRIVQSLATDIGLQVCEAPFADVARKALTETWTRDVFDRIVVAQARIAEARLITRDRAIQTHYRRALG